MLISYLVAGFHVASFYAALLTALALGLVNALIRPILIILTLPLNILTFGLFTFIINGILFLFVATVIKGFEVTGFWPALWGALIFSVCSLFINLVDKEKNA